MTGHPANPNEAVVQRAATAATEIATLRDELEQQTTRADELDERLEETKLLLHAAHRERGRIIDLLDVDENTPGFFDGFAGNLADLIAGALNARSGMVMLAFAVASVLMAAGIGLLALAWWGMA